jgi:hypothetical protein
MNRVGAIAFVHKIADALIPEELPPLVFAPSGAENRVV